MHPYWIHFRIYEYLVHQMHKLCLFPDINYILNHRFSIWSQTSLCTGMYIISYFFKTYLTLYWTFSYQFIYRFFLLLLYLFNVIDFVTLIIKKKVLSMLNNFFRFLFLFVFGRKRGNWIWRGQRKRGNFIVLMHHLGLCLTTKPYIEIPGLKKRRGKNKTRGNEICRLFHSSAIINKLCRFYIKTNNLWDIKKGLKYSLIKKLPTGNLRKHFCTAMTWSIISNRHSETGRVWCHMGRIRAAEIGFYMSIKEMLTLLKQNGCQWGYAQMPSSSSYWLRDGRVLAKCSMGKKIRLVCEYIQVEVTRKRRRRISFQRIWCYYCSVRFKGNWSWICA